ncbi:NitT/TauT family transport system permease protein [Rathayibacter sp. PhB127]|uniref:ABC transporter permease n=1 Tax=Rathayibacter sp. PhB127 TaxID=2485176 RepID=UPI000FAC13BA|nr:ABC transporter permease [Rathayibacter sp. PhB127]ROS21485.1 NitT/TauT family transport system permease protein [Rathayibacter sp. PhB127]
MRARSETADATATASATGIGSVTAPASAQHRTTALRIATRLGTVALAILLWQLLTTGGARLWLSFGTLPPPTEVLAALQAQIATGALHQDVLASLGRIGVGVVLAGVLGTVVGVAVARSGFADASIGTLVAIARPIPAIALVPIAILLFPTSEQGIVAITFAAAFFPVAVSTRHAVRALPASWEDAVRTMGGGRLQVLARVVLPGALPGIVAGLSVGVGVAWVCVISAEMISGQFGIGYRTWQSYTVVDYPAVVAGMTVIGLLGWLTSAAVERLGRRATSWLPRGDA